MSNEISFLEFDEPPILVKEEEKNAPPKFHIENIVDTRENNLETLTAQITATPPSAQLERIGIVDLPVQTYTKKEIF